MTPKLSDSQLVVLSTACQRPDAFVFPVTLKLKGNAIGNVLKSLLTKGLLEEIAGRADDTIWRYDDDGAPLTLRATQAAFEALGIEPEDAPQGAAGAEETGAAEDEATAEVSAPVAPSAAPARKTRDNSKQAQLIAMLKRSEGATIDEIVDAFGWQAHTVRGAIAGALKKKLGLDVTSEKVDGRGRVYRIAG
ncbi:MAG TPA: DUF3489 domain-containing protein [Xanthobacteraceae bacterium]|nr:DUF3489 domain-containing protein [Xanthobacteraceae bacterium]